MNKFNLRSLLLLGVCLVPLAAYAQDEGYDVGEIAPASHDTAKPVSYDSEAWLGTKWQSDTSALAGRYNGSPNGGFAAVGGFTINDRPTWDSGDTFYFQATGDNLSVNDHYLLPDSSVQIKFGQQGSWGVTSFYDSIPYIQSLHFNTAYSTSGNLLLGTPYTVNSKGVGSGGLNMTGIGTAATTNSTTNATQNAADQRLSNAANNILEQMTVGTQRDKVGAALNYLLPGGDWSFTTGLQHEHKEGTIEASMLMGSGTSLNSAGGSIVYFPLPINYDTDRYDATLAYNAKNVQNQISYSLSRFIDNNLDFQAQDPFQTTGLANGFQAAAYALPPSNLAHQVKDQFGYNITPSTRFNANLGYGLQLQNASYAPETINSVVSLPAGPGGVTADGMIQNIFANGVLTTRPFTNADFKASFTYNNRDNESERKAYQNMLNDTTSCSSTVTTKCSEFLSNAPYSFRTAGGTLEGGYKIISSTKVTFGDTYEDKLRNYSAADQNHENTVYGRVNTALTNDVHGMLGLSNAIRTASGYYGQAAYSALGNTEATQVEGNSLLMQYSEAARDRQELKGSLTWSPDQDVALSLTSKYYTDNYPGSPFGITGDHTVEIDPDLSYSPLNDVKTHFFYSYERVNYMLNDGLYVSKTTTVGTAWNLNTTNNIHTFGTSSDWQVDNKLKLGLTYTCQLGATAFNENAWGAAIANYTPVSQLPTDNSVLNSVNLHAEYKLMDNVTLIGGYAFERFVSKDYLYNQAATSPQYANYLLPGDGNPSYVNNVVTAALHVKF